MRDPLLLGIDGGGTKCRARLCSASGAVLGEGIAGPANLRFGLERGFAAAMAAADRCLEEAGLSRGCRRRIVACLAFAGATEPETLAAAVRHPHPFARAIVTNDGHAACIGAHEGRDGGVVAVGTGLIGWAIIRGRHHRIGGWGFPISDEGSGAWLGCEAVRRALWAHDGRAAWTPMLVELLGRFRSDPHTVVRWMTEAQPADFAALAPLAVQHAGRGDEAGVELMRLAGGHVDAAARRLIDLGAPRMSIVGGLARGLDPWLSPQIRKRLSPARGDALAGAVSLAAAELEELAAG